MEKALPGRCVDYGWTMDYGLTGAGGPGPLTQSLHCVGPGSPSFWAFWIAVTNLGGPKYPKDAL